MASRSHQAVVAMQTLLVVLPCTAVISMAVAAAAYRRGLSKGAALAGEGGGRAAGMRGGVCDTTDEEEVEEEREVERVLSVWFDGSTADNHRTKWFAQVRWLFRYCTGGAGACGAASAGTAGAGTAGAGTAGAADVGVVAAVGVVSLLH